MGKQSDLTVTTGMNGSGHNPDGTFAAGNQLARGRTTRPAELRKALENAVSAEDVAKLAKSLLTQANLGDTSAAKVLLDRVVPSLTIETEVRRRLEAWKENFLSELLYATNRQSLRARLVGFEASPDEQTTALLELLGGLDAFQENA